MHAPLVDVFVPAYEVWETRQPTLDEMIANKTPEPIKVRLVATIHDALSAAKHVAAGVHDNGLANHIATSLIGSVARKAWQALMPSTTPAAIASYQKNYATSDLSAVSNDIEMIGRPLAYSQCLFHGGLWTGGAGMVTDRPLSTSFCPQVAFKNAEWNGKAYDAGRIDLIVLRAVNPKTKAYLFKQKGTSLGHEKEVLLASKASLIPTGNKSDSRGFPS